MDIPKHFPEIAAPFRYGGSLKKAQDQFGEPLETELADVLTTAGQINTEGAQYLSDFLDSFDAEDLPEAEKQKLAGTLKCFAADGAGNPFFMDFSQSSEQPAVVYWDDGILALRTVAASPEDFFALFVPED